MTRFNSKSLLILLLFGISLSTNAQVAINTDSNLPDDSAMLDVKSTDQEMLIPRIDTGQRNLINSPATRLLIFDNDTKSFWFYNGSIWEDLSSMTLDEIANVSI